MGDKDDAEVVQLENLRFEDRLSIDGEIFTVQQIENNVINLLPESENGGGMLVYHEDSDLWVFRRNKGLDPEQIQVIE